MVPNMAGGILRTSAYESARGGVMAIHVARVAKRLVVAAMTLLGKRAVKSLLIYGVIALCMTCGVQYVFADLLHLFLP